MNYYKLVIETRAGLAGLPEQLVAAAAETARKAGLEGKWVFTLHAPSIWPFLQYAEERELRRRDTRDERVRPLGEAKNDAQSVSDPSAYDSRILEEHSFTAPRGFAEALGDAALTDSARSRLLADGAVRAANEARLRAEARTRDEGVARAWVEKRTREEAARALETRNTEPLPVRGPRTQPDRPGAHGTSPGRSAMLRGYSYVVTVR